MSKNNIRKKRQYRTLLSVLAAGSTPEARQLVKTNTGEDCLSEVDLEEKLARIYASSDSKIDLEKEFAKIHPHKDFILKYCQPPMPEPIDLAKLNTANTEVVKQVEIVTPPRPELQKPTEGWACACGTCGAPMSNADGVSMVRNPSGNMNMTIVVLGLVSIVAIAGTIMYLKSQKN